MTTKKRRNWAENSIGMKYNRLTVISVNRINNKTYCLCKCECGNTTNVLLDGVRRGNTTSCGCYHKEKIRTHNLSKTKTYTTWRHLISRCKKDFKYGKKNYYDKGITVCDEWKNSFEIFFKDMGNPPSNSHSIDRIDNNKGYYKENCRWATIKEQMRNTSRNAFVKINGTSKCKSEWAELYKIKYHIFLNRLNKGWDPKIALITPINERARYKRILASIDQRKVDLEFSKWDSL